MTEPTKRNSRARYGISRRALLTGAGAMSLAAAAGGLRAQDQTAHHMPLAFDSNGLQGGALLDPPESGPLPIPQLLDPRENGGRLHLTAQSDQHTYAPNWPAVECRTYGGALPGPVLRLHRGDSVEITLENRLDEATTTHWHGMLVPGWLDGGAHGEIAPGETWHPVLEIDQPESTLWFHPHSHHDVGRQLYMGMSGMILLEDGTGARLGLPREYGIDDIPLILQDLKFTPDGTLSYPKRSRERLQGMRGDMMVVNGAISPHATVPAGLVRLRLVNAANARNYHLHFSDGREFHVIASDGGYIAAPVAMTRLTIAPGERFEILVDFSDERGVSLETDADRPDFHRTAIQLGATQTFSPMGNPRSAAGTLVHFAVDPALVASVTEIPEMLIEPEPLDTSGAAGRRQITMDMWPGWGGQIGAPGGEIGPGLHYHTGGRGPAMGINGRVFDMDRIDFDVALGSAEIWEVTGFLMPHPFHAHGVQFRVLSMDGAPPPPHLAGAKDTVLLQGPVELLVEFTQPAPDTHPFMLHCHMMDHEEAGMMAQFTVS